VAAKPKFNKLTILGAGSWGTALSLYLARLGHTITLWTPDKDRASAMQQSRCNQKYLPTITFPENLTVTADLAEALNVQDVLIAVPSAGYRKLLTTLQPLLSKQTRLICATKGLDAHSSKFLHEVTQEILGEHAHAVLSGPTFAREVSLGLPTATVIASTDENFSQDLVNIFNSATFRIYTSKDVVGTEVGGVVKNVLAIAAGITDGMQLGANARCALITRGLAEMIRLGVKLGAQKETFNGLAGLGDLILTCTDNQSRNRRFGLALGAGKSIAEAKAEIGQVIEGETNAKILIQLAHKHQIEMPICEIVLKILQGELDSKQAVDSLLNRSPKAE